MLQFAHPALDQGRFSAFATAAPRPDYLPYLPLTQCVIWRSGAFGGAIIRMKMWKSSSVFGHAAR
jgi:hypothetical protein